MGLDKTFIILGAPRSGSTLLFRLLSQHKDLWHLVAESHKILEGPLHPTLFTSFSNRPENLFMKEEDIDNLRRNFYRKAVNYAYLSKLKRYIDVYEGKGARFFQRIAGELIGTGSLPLKSTSISFLEKTPKNAVRVKAIETIFPDSKYLVLERDAISNIRSLYFGWRASENTKRRGRFNKSGYPIMTDLELQDFSGKYWTFILPPNWKKLKNKTLLDVCFFQYYATNYWLKRDLEEIPSDRKIYVSYKRLVGNSIDEINYLLGNLNLDVDKYDYTIATKMPRINNVQVKQEDKKVITKMIHEKMKTFDINEYL
ncbi:MAG: sulfotransferase [Saprospiraceae bacterium]